jgi:hypothetical protein
MDQETQNLIKARFASLTPDVKRAVSDAHLPERVENIASKNALHIDQTGGLLTEVYLVMLGMEKSNNFPQNISKNLNIPIAVATAVASDVNGEIFLPIRQSLIKMSAEREALEREVSEEIPNPERDQIMHDIENPVPTPERGAKPITDPSRGIAARSATDNFVADKLSTPSVSSASMTAAKTPLQNPDKKPAADPYREPIN